MTHTIQTPLSDDIVHTLKAGDEVRINGIIYTARDAAHKRLTELLETDSPLPFDLRGQIIYYTGPTPTPPGRAIGSCGPTTSYRMDKYTPTLLDLGLRGMIGKGRRSQAVIDSIIKNGAVYFAAVGGAGALLSKAITEAEVVAYEDLGTEALRRLEVKDFPVIVVIDSEGNNLYDSVAKT